MLKKITTPLLKFQKKWNLTPFRTIIILCVFAFTGISSLWFRPIVIDALALPEAKIIDNPIAALLKIFILIPIYYLLLLCYGTLLGEFAFFFNMVKRPFRILKKSLRKLSRCFYR